MPNECLTTATNTNKTVLLYITSFSPLCCLDFSWAFALFDMFLSLIWLSFIPLGLLLETVFHLFGLWIFTHLNLFCSMSETQRITDQIVTLDWILSGTMSTTFRRTRRRTYITMALNISSSNKTTEVHSRWLSQASALLDTYKAHLLVHPTFLVNTMFLCKASCLLLQSSYCTLFLYAKSLSESELTRFAVDQQIRQCRR